MKTINLILLFVAATFTAAFSQNKLGPSPYIFPQFVSGSVLQKGGGATEGMLNYNTVTQEMIFMQGTEKIVLEMGAIDTVYLQNKKFVPVNNVCYEKLTNTKIPLYQQHVNSMKSRIKNADLAQQSNNTVTASQGFRSAVNQSSKYELTLSDDYTLEAHDVFWVQKGKSFSKITDLKSILKAFPGKDAAIDAFIKDKKLDITKAEDLTQVVIYCNL